MIKQRHAVVSSFGLLVLSIIAEVANAGPPRKIVGGSEAAPGEFPYLVSLQNNGELFCGGAIISSRYVLTASHCIHHNMVAPYSEIAVVTGTTLLSKGGKTYRVSKVIPHEGFDLTIPISSHDIGLIKLKSDITFDTYTSSISLPNKITPGDGVSAIVAGWGHKSDTSEMASETLQKANMTTIDSAKCQSIMEEAVVIYTEQICGFNSMGIGTCYGDSGGPLVAGSEIIGVASYSLPCARGYPDVYTAVSYYIDWINKNTK